MLCTVELLGFPPNDQRTLTATFSLSARRETSFTQWQTSAGQPPHVVLVDADNPEAMAVLAQRRSSGTCSMPVVAVAAQQPAQVSHFLERPIRFLTLFKMLDQVLMRSASVSQTANGSESRAPAVHSSNIAAPVSAKTAGMAPGLVAASANTPAARTPVAQSNYQQASTPIVRLQASSTFPPVAPTTPAKPAHMLPDDQLGSNKPTGDWVLVVDDNLAVRRFMAQKLEQFNINIDFAATGEQAVGLTGTKHYTCIFLDVVMPGIDGYQVCKLIKGNRISRDVKIVMLTSRDSPFDKIRGKMAGCDAYLTKPVDEEKLMNTIVRFLPEGALMDDVLERNSSFPVGTNS